MSACPQDQRELVPEAQLRAMRSSDVPAVLAIERLAYELPWTEGNFIDSLAAGYSALVLQAADGAVLGYCLAMQGFGEVHLLNIAVDPVCQGRGLARRMLAALAQLCRERKCPQLWLEVRVSNQRAREVYLQYGFREVGLRPAYYPVLQGAREDAVLMSLDVLEAQQP
ncbi:ribosomal protein S18-alanine N-acetyltransferase [Paucibacter sp. DJ2R-2]|uniref:ribosomal protein S18-alanine N-acetyltransferase n=1 Tax=Paucibacter sp. DJ2R-2 TaxID=2893558 RepID=UPI0021E4F53C|nr:ribosomal protein S18-alanine N-acetyltransferase [Paucibacter sp. DJ2R-2]MCV2419852.1 ribosomal protein S18-alanine N-acetyltransferase [Paucibacter sp. DJ4R-1]MCV2437245.1 ribosomal protein S18-alanine N-acetyltransferase [Paucibacter sp. DJ2R-2]